MAKRLVVTMAVLATTAIVGTTSAGAVLSPYWQRVTEMQTIAGDQRVAEALGQGAPIQSIRATGTEVYEVETERCVVTVTIVDTPSDKTELGARQFDLDVGAPDCG
ncbi:hypothetical protein [Bauldia sp.]|uniref:hypothetical protein n=1 Tax=Bauldia sp. TaxID=2575872 RepID=UPI003BAA6507